MAYAVVMRKHRANTGHVNLVMTRQEWQQAKRNRDQDPDHPYLPEEDGCLVGTPVFLDATPYPDPVS